MQALNAAIRRVAEIEAREGPLTAAVRRQLLAFYNKAVPDLPSDSDSDSDSESDSDSDWQIHVYFLLIINLIYKYNYSS